MIIYPTRGHELADPAYRDRVYDTASGRFLDAVETLAAYDAGTLIARRVRQNTQPHPSYGTRAPDGGNYDVRDGGTVEMTRADLAALFDEASGTGASWDATSVWALGPGLECPACGQTVDVPMPCHTRAEKEN